MHTNVLKQAEQQMKKVEENFVKEVGSLRLGRASISMLDTIIVEYYGSRLPINQLATITIPQPQLIVIQPWDKASTEKIVKAIQLSDLGFNPLSDGTTIKVPVPPMSGERRQEVVKILKKMEEQAKIEIREIRRKANDELKKMEKEKKISEDNCFTSIEKIQKSTDSSIANLEKKTTSKEEEILET
ncbi:MAG: ribosome recycling factor [Candidatus Ratteibacteria bacterium]|jgi:ribosome recycling factor